MELHRDSGACPRPWRFCCYLSFWCASSSDDSGQREASGRPYLRFPHPKPPRGTQLVYEGSVNQRCHKLLSDPKPSFVIRDGRTSSIHTEPIFLLRILEPRQQL